MTPFHLAALPHVEDRDLSRAAAERHLVLQDVRLGRPPAVPGRGIRRLVPARLRRRLAVRPACPAPATP